MGKPSSAFTAFAESPVDALEDQETARTKGKAIGGVKVSDEDMLATVLRLRDDERLSLRETRNSRWRRRSPAPRHRAFSPDSPQGLEMTPRRCSRL
ncbi:hypothetical protein ACFVYE_41745 [Streptomyces sp. NPDC058239]|uniref:hypothetical protein n=1 Tax=Streptomyces sp. NPDC058239 TaxID=3346395 RepID=UPI0036ED5BDE